MKTVEDFEKWIANPFMLNKQENPAIWGGDDTKWKKNPYEHPYTRGAYDMFLEMNKHE